MVERVVGSRQSLLQRLSEDGASLVICALNGIGDGLLALSILRRALVVAGPSRVVFWVAEDVLETAFLGLPGVRVPIHVDRWGHVFCPDPETDLTRLAQVMLAPGPRLWLSLNAYFPLDPIELRGRQIVGPDSIWEFGQNPEDLRRHPDGQARHMCEQYLLLVGEHPDRPGEGQKPVVSEMARMAVREFTEGNAPELVVHLDTTAEKEWPCDWWDELFTLARARMTGSIYLIGRPPSWTANLKGIYKSPSGWQMHVALLESARAFIGVDSCFGHAANAFGRPGVVLFRESDPNEWGPDGMALVPVLGPPLSGLAEFPSPASVLSIVLDRRMATEAQS